MRINFWAVSLLFFFGNWIALPTNATSLPVGWVLETGSVGGVSTGVANLEPTHGVEFGFIDNTGSADLIATGVPNAISGSVMLSSEIPLQLGDVLSLDLNFLTNDGEFYEDFAFVHLLQSGVTVAVMFTANTTGPFDQAVPAIGGPGGISPGVHLDPMDAGFDGNFTGLLNGIPYGPDKFFGGPGGATGWVTSTFSPGEGIYQLLFVVGDVLDVGSPSALAIDNIRTERMLVESFEAINAIPEPSSAMLAGVGLLLLFASLLTRGVTGGRRFTNEIEKR